jgi:hypothetical protein
MLRQVLSGALLASIATSAFAAEVDWNFNGRAVAAGTACKSMGDDADTFFITAGNEISVVFSRLGINLGDEYAPTAERHTCNIRIPVRIAKGHYIGRLEQTLLYGVTKSARSSAEISARATFFNKPAAFISRTFPRGVAMDEALQTATSSQDYQVFAPSWCVMSTGLNGMYSANLAIAGQRDNPYENLVVQVDGADIKFQAVAGWYRCNL